MCGLVGVASINNLTDQQKYTFRTMLILDTLRGFDSTGVARIKPGGGTNYLKSAEHAAKFLYSEQTEKFLGDDARAYIGHNRAATKGAVNSDNAHPFLHGDVVLAHNGTLWSWDTLPRPVGQKRKFTVDSEAVAYAMSVTEDKTALLESLNGAFALSWYDLRDQSIYLSRDDQRPLLFARDKAMTHIYWASEEKFLKGALGEDELLADYDLFEVVPGQIIKFDMTLESMKYDVEEFDVIPLYQGGGHWGGHGNYSGNGAGNGHWRGPNARALPAPSAAPPAEKGVLPAVKTIIQVDFKSFSYYHTNAGEKQEFGTWRGWCPLCSCHVVGYYVHKDAATSTIPLSAEVVGSSQDKIHGDQVNVAIVSNVYKTPESNVVDLTDNKTPLEEELYVQLSGGIHIPYDEWVALRAQGCSICGQAIADEESQDTSLEDDELICEECADYLEMASRDHG